MRTRSWLVISGSLMALLIGVVAFFSGLRGFSASANLADSFTAWPNVITGLASIVASFGFWALKKWSEYVYLPAFVGHVITQIMLYTLHGTGGRALPVVTLAFLAVIPLVSLAVLIDMEYQRRQGALA